MRIDIDNNEALKIVKALADSGELLLAKRIKLIAKLDTGSRKITPSSVARESTASFKRKDKAYRI